MTTIMKPIIILPPDVMSDEHQKLLRDNGLCVVVASEPGKVKFVDPIPAASSRTKIEDACIKLSRILLNRQWGNYNTSSSIGITDFSKIYLDALMEGTPLDSNGTFEEQETRFFNTAKREELQRLARVEAKEEREAAKAAKAKAKP